MVGDHVDGIGAVAGFNHNDITSNVSVRFEELPGSGTDAVKDFLTATSNVDQSGVWMFQVDQPAIISRECSVFLTVEPLNKGHLETSHFESLPSFQRLKMNYCYRKGVQKSDTMSLSWRGLHQRFLYTVHSWHKPQQRGPIGDWY